MPISTTEGQWGVGRPQVPLPGGWLPNVSGKKSKTKYFQTSLPCEPQAVWHESGVGGGGWEIAALQGTLLGAKLFFSGQSFGLILNLDEGPASAGHTEH